MLGWRNLCAGAVLSHDSFFKVLRGLFFTPPPSFSDLLTMVSSAGRVGPECRFHCNQAWQNAPLTCVRSTVACKWG